MCILLNTSPTEALQLKLNSVKNPNWWEANQLVSTNWGHFPAVIGI